MFLKKILFMMKNFLLQFTKNKTYKADNLKMYTRVIEGSDVVEAVILREYVNIFEGILKNLSKTTDPKTFINHFNNLKTLCCKLKDIDQSGNISNAMSKHIENMSYKRIGNDDEDICYFVTFGGSSKKYCYLSNGIQYSVGQYVVVPVGDAMEQKVAKITDRKTIKEKKNLKTIIKSAI